MNLVQRYVFRKLLSAFLIAFPALALTIWATQAIRQLSLVTDQGQSLGVLLQAIVLLLPGLFMIIGPASMLIVVVYVINGLNSDSELVSINSSGQAAGILIRPLLVLAAPIFLLSVVSAIYFAPIAARASKELTATVSADVIGSLIRPGQFLSLADRVVIQVRDILPGGQLRGIFLFDQRNPDQSVAYIAGSGAIVNREAGTFLVMQDGVIQRREGGAVSAIEFESYVFDLSSVRSREVRTLEPEERPFTYLLAPDPDDPIQQTNPFRYEAEVHLRITTPFYVLVLALLPAALLSSPRSPRRGSQLLTTVTVVLSALLIGGTLYFGAALETARFLLFPVYAIPIAGIVFPIWSMAGGGGMFRFRGRTAPASRRSAPERR